MNKMYFNIFKGVRIREEEEIKINYFCSLERKKYTNSSIFIRVAIMKEIRSCGDKLTAAQKLELEKKLKGVLKNE